MPWYVLYTKSRNEKKLSQLLEDKGIEVYCPLMETIKQWSDRKKKVKEPVFRSYVFVSLDDYEKESVNALNTPGAVRFLRWLGKPGIVREKEIQAIRNFLNSYKDAIINIKLEEGQEVVINEGPLKGKSGEILHIRGKKVVLYIKGLGMNMTAEITAPAIDLLK